MYSFRKVKNGVGMQEFFHTHFKRGAFDELGFIQRKKVLAKGMRSLRYSAGKETNHRLEILEAKLEDMLNQNRLLITTNKRFSAKIARKNKECAARERKMLFMCAAMSSKLCSVKDLREMLKSHNIKSPEYDSDIYMGVMGCFKQTILTEHNSSDFIDNLLSCSLSEYSDSETRYGLYIATRVKHILEKVIVEPELPQNILIPKTAFAFHFPKPRPSVMEPGCSPVLHKNMLDMEEDEADARKLISPAYSGYKMSLSGDEYLEQASNLRSKEVQS